MIRIIGGQYKRLKIDIPDLKDVRPTQDRVREAIFSILHDRVVGTLCLDLFAGSGAYGFEAISRGARFVDFVDKQNICIECINSTAKRLKCQGYFRTYKREYSSAVDMFINQGKKYDIIFLDPPYAMDVNEELAKKFAKANLLTKNGILVVEQEKELPEIEGYELKSYKYSYKRVGIYKRGE